MTEEELKALLARNPHITARDNQTLREISPTFPEPGTPDALDSLVSGEEKSQGLPKVRFVFCRTQPVDVDAVAAGAKDLLDGLSEAGLIPGDAPNQIQFEASQKVVSTKKEEGTIIEIVTL